jgi:AAA domain/RepB DNA-primase N-terminal domain
VATAIDLCNLAWRGRTGYVGISIRDPKLTKEDKGYWVDKTYAWPAESARVEQVLEAARTSKKDVYFAPQVFNRPARDAEAVGVSDILYADLDEIDPTSLPKHLKPTAAWETSPNRWQAMWKLTMPIDASAQSALNQRLTYAIGADKGGWDLTQVLRIPGSHNHKYVEAPPVQLLWLNGHQLDPLKLVDDLPEITAATDELPSGAKTLAKYKSRLNARIRELTKARHATVGTRSDRLWELECLLAERNFSDVEIAAVCKETVWNKFEGRRNEVKQLLTEARKAILHAAPTAPEPDDDTDFEVIEDAGPQSWREFDKQHEAISWLVADLWGEGEVGFISGHPKTYKSWIALDLAVSVATGTRFLHSFQAKRHSVLLVQEEDPKPILQDRLTKVAAAKGLIWGRQVDDTNFTMRYELPDNLHIISNQGFTITEEWLEMLERWVIDRDVRMVILDPLMMIAGAGFDEFKAFDFMEKVLKPLKRFRARTHAAIVVVHHHLKGGTTGGARDMYGSVALWAWEEAAMHLSLPGPGKVVAERFSKNALFTPVTIEIGEVKEVWQPHVVTGIPSDGLLDLILSMGHATLKELEDQTGTSPGSLTRQLDRLVEQGQLKLTHRKDGPGRPAKTWSPSTPSQQEPSKDTTPGP